MKAGILHNCMTFHQKVTMGVHTKQPVQNAAPLMDQGPLLNALVA
jgi:hypothetical protein